MAGTTVRIKEESRSILEELAREMDEPMQDILAKALESYRRLRIIEMTNTAYAVLRMNPESWRSVQEEREAWDVALADQLADEDVAEEA
ncbi:MAG: toxin-antitoxin system protein [Dehalococcoidia bacterium]|nr:toxin-antitoxin system protein [Dehalococcoidia bacterium]